MSGGPALLERPREETGEAVYSNFDHKMAAEVVSQLAGHPGTRYAQHAAWNFCGYVWLLPDGRWVDQVWRYGMPVEDVIGDTIEDVIDDANSRYGTD